MTELIKPARLRQGDTVAAISVSGGRAGDEDMRWRYELGKKRLEECFGLHVVETPHALAGSDYLYHGQTVFRGVHTDDTLVINTKENDAIRMKTPTEVFPEYFIIRVNEFNKVATTPLEEWLDYLKNGHIKDDTTAPGLSEAKEKLKCLTMTRQEKLDYERHLDAIMIQNDVIDTAKAEGRAEGRAEGLAEANISHAQSMKALGVSNEVISTVTGLSLEEIEGLPSSPATHDIT